MKRKYSVGYFSSYDRGLACLLEMWPEVRKAVPKATLDIYYGWDMFDKVHARNTEQMKWKWNVLRKLHDLKDQGVTEHGRVNHQELADAMKEIKAWAYPTEFPEINCITALKAQEAGMIPVTTNVGALTETVIDPRFMSIGDDIYTSKEHQEMFIEHMTKALLGDFKVKPVPNIYWSDIAKQWANALD